MGPWSELWNHKRKEEHPKEQMWNHDIMRVKETSLNSCEDSIAWPAKSILRSDGSLRNIKHWAHLPLEVTEWRLLVCARNSLAGAACTFMCGVAHRHVHTGSYERKPFAVAEPISYFLKAFTKNPVFSRPCPKNSYNRETESALNRFRLLET